MNADESPIESEAAFADALRSLLRRGHDGDVTVEGGWECLTDGDGLPDWDVVVTEVASDGGSGAAQATEPVDAEDD